MPEGQITRVSRPNSEEIGVKRTSHESPSLNLAYRVDDSNRCYKKNEYAPLLPAYARRTCELIVLLDEEIGANNASEVMENTKMAKIEARTTEVCIFSLNSRSTSRTKGDTVN
jgi:hypothetical protein